MYKMVFFFFNFFFFFTLLYLLPFHRKLVCLSSMKNHLKLLQRISFLRFAFRSFIFLCFFLLLLFLFLYRNHNIHKFKKKKKKSITVYAIAVQSTEYTLQQFVYIRHVFVSEQLFLKPL